MKTTTLALVIIVTATSTVFADDKFRCRLVGNDWVWFEDHLALTVNYATRGPEGRTYEVGTGISVGGSPWGKRKRYKGDAEFTAFGAGALHIRRRDEGADFTVCASGLGLRTIPLIPPNTKF